MRTAHCDCCGTSTEAYSLEVLRTVGWTVVEHSPGECLVLLCPVCHWQRKRAVDVVSEAVEAAYAAREIRGEGGGGRPTARRMGWFWS